MVFDLQKLALIAPAAVQAKEETEIPSKEEGNKVGSHIPTASTGERKPSSEVDPVKVPELVKEEKTTLSKAQVRPPKISPQEVSADEVTNTSAENVPSN
jgi:hypothetical protein